LAIETDLFGEIDDAHPALPERAEDLVRPENEAAVPTGQQLLCLERRKHPRFDERLGARKWLGGQVVLVDDSLKG
jgi:hypothetical protein